MKKNPFAERLAAFVGKLKEAGVEVALVCGEANVKALTGVDCDNACLKVTVAPEGRAPGVVFYTDFRYVPMVNRVAPWVKVDDLKKMKFKARRIGYESSITAAKFEKLKKDHKGATFIDIAAILHDLRAVKTADEIAKLRAAEALNDEIWAEAQKSFRPGMTEREMARVIQHLMIERGEGEAFATIVCVGKNAAECHHVPDDTVWNGREPVLVDMGVKLDGYCSDMTRNLVPARASKLYRKVYDLVRRANELGIQSARPGLTSGRLDAIVRKFLKDNGFEKEFGHSLGHGVGIEIHEAPWAAKKQKTVLRPGMSVTIEPGIYLVDNLGVRIEDLVVITDDGCEVLSHSAK